MLAKARRSLDRSRKSLAERVRRDVPLETALEEHRAVFTPEEVSAVRACKSLLDLALALEAL